MANKYPFTGKHARLIRYNINVSITPSCKTHQIHRRDSFDNWNSHDHRGYALLQL